MKKQNHTNYPTGAVRRNIQDACPIHVGFNLMGYGNFKDLKTKMTMHKKYGDGQRRPCTYYKAHWEELKNVYFRAPGFLHRAMVNII